MLTSARSTRRAAGAPTSTPPPIPAVMRISLYVLLLTGGALSIPRIGDYSPMPMANLLDAWLCVLILVCVARGRIHHSAALLLRTLGPHAQ